MEGWGWREAVPRGEEGGLKHQKPSCVSFTDLHYKRTECKMKRQSVGACKDSSHYFMRGCLNHPPSGAGAKAMRSISFSMWVFSLFLAPHYSSLSPDPCKHFCAFIQSPPPNIFQGFGGDKQFCLPEQQGGTIYRARFCLRAPGVPSEERALQGSAPTPGVL